MSPYRSTLEKHPVVYGWTFRLMPLGAILVFLALALGAASLAHRDEEARKTHRALCGLLNLASANSRITLSAHPGQLAKAQAFYRQARRVADCKERSR